MFDLGCGGREHTIQYCNLIRMDTESPCTTQLTARFCSLFKAFEIAKAGHAAQNPDCAQTGCLANCGQHSERKKEFTASSGRFNAEAQTIIIHAETHGVDSATRRC